ncbi:hypothetical protein DFH07DRAFT_760218 [Mycena maculata]|uniref:F-box domain-containing protein n=1 Tax=Mycena maculata TaxID=230809 RepID=A0AAD7MKQ9_9AGAR|nr:hypothetical protein DFH07DRAFT_760218 [Mycena maculata]
MAATWHTLPTEMKLAVVDNLDVSDAKVFSTVDQRTYAVCVPVLFRDIKLSSHSDLDRFLENVPRAYCRHIEHLDLGTEGGKRAHAEALISLLLASPRISQLVLRLQGSLDKSVISCFAFLANLRHLTIRNCAEEVALPLSERLVVSIAASVPELQYLSLERISRSTLHAPELVGKYPFVPLVRGDEDIPDHPVLGSELSLPSLLSIQSLRQLTIRDTHLGDPRWSSAPVACRLEVLDLGNCAHEADAPNRLAIERIMSAVGPSLSSFSLATALSARSPADEGIFAKPSTPLPRLRRLHISPFFPVDEVVDTMAALAGSPIEALSVQCFADDVADACGALEAFLSMRVARGPAFYEKLARIDVSVAGEEGVDNAHIDVRATKRLQDFCHDLRLTSRVTKPHARTCDRLRSNSCAF